jgi:hypothetical protein
MPDDWRERQGFQDDIPIVIALQHTQRFAIWRVTSRR